MAWAPKIGVAVGVSEYNEDAVKELRASRIQIEGLRAKIEALESENAVFKNRGMPPSYGSVQSHR